MDFNTIHDIIHQDAGNQSEYCPLCNGSMDKKNAEAAAGTILKRQRSGFGGPRWGGDDKKDKKDPLHNTLHTGTAKLNKASVYPMTEIVASEDGKLPSEIQIMPIGEWDTVPYGKLIITADDLHQMAENFKQGVRAGVPIDVDHDGKAAAGWIEKLSVKEDGLYANVSWSDMGKKLLGERQYRFFSPEFNPEYVDPENKHLQLSNVLIAGSLVNRPLFKELKPLVANDHLTAANKGVILFIENMKKENLLNKKYGEMTDEEKKYCGENFSAEEKKAAGFPEMKKEEPKKEEKKVEAGEPTKAVETVSISASEYAALKANADRGVEAAEKLEAKEIDEAISSMIFSENGGHFAPAVKDELTGFYKSLNQAQRKTFSEMVEKMPQTKMLFTEMGNGEDLSKGAVADAVTIAAKELMAKDKTLKFSEAVKKAISANKALEDYELIPVKGRVQVLNK